MRCAGIEQPHEFEMATAQSLTEKEAGKSKPLGISSWDFKAAARVIRYFRATGRRRDSGCRYALCGLPGMASTSVENRRLAKD
ncbi:MAG TPA: hypothetical protein VHX20_09450 [Terracidiphilus sp.]|jgi:hypothetical protein|nr:hypothetical protein [Terracidiphilus sp.]